MPVWKLLAKFFQNCPFVYTDGRKTETFGAAGYPKSVRLPLAMCGLFPAVQKVPPPMYPPRVEPCMPATLILKHPFKGSKNTEKKTVNKH